MLQKIFNKIIIPMCCLFSIQACADDNMFVINGFGTLGAVHSDNTDADFVSSVFRPTGAGYNNSWSAAVDSKVGIQLNAAFTNDLKAVVQVMEKQRYNDNYEPSVEWAFLSYSVTPDLTVRIGRVDWPLFVRSENINVGYSNFSMRSSAELAAEMPNTHNDGVDISFHSNIGSASNTVTLIGGSSKENYAPPASLEVKNITGVSDMLEFDNLTLHAAYMHMKYTFNYPGTPPLPVSLPMYTVGANYDTARFYATGDYMIAPDPNYGRMIAYAFLGGVHLDQFSPYIGYSQFKQATFGTGVASYGSAYLSTTPKESTTALGLRWDFMKNYDVKIQYDHVSSGIVELAFPISFVKVQPNFFNHSNANIFSVAVDFVF